MHFPGTERRVEPIYIQRWDSFTKVRFNGIDSLVEKKLQTTDEPFAGFGIGEVDYGHAGLPEVPLEDISVLALQEVAFAGSEFENWGCLREVWVDPNADSLHKT